VTRATLAKLRDALSQIHGLRIGVLFGSHATGRSHPGSDYDIAILTEHEPSLRDELALATSLSEITGTQVDVVRLDKDEPLLQREIALSGVCLFEAEPGLWAAHRARAMSRWIDFDELVAPYRRRFLERLAGARL
jgi:predicted nucleotidyltransferase